MWSNWRATLQCSFGLGGSRAQVAETLLRRESSSPKAPKAQGPRRSSRCRLSYLLYLVCHLLEPEAFDTAPTVCEEFRHSLSLWPDRPSFLKTISWISKTESSDWGPRGSNADSEELGGPAKPRGLQFALFSFALGWIGFLPIWPNTPRNKLNPQTAQGFQNVT